MRPLTVLSVFLGLMIPAFVHADGPLPTTGPVTVWSEPVNGIAVRIEQGVPVFASSRWESGASNIFVRIRNVSAKAVAVPLAPVVGRGVYTVMISVADRWEPLADQSETAAVEPEFCTLSPGEEQLCPVPIPWTKRRRLAEAERVVIDQPETAGGSWSGRVETPALPAYIDPAAIVRLRGTLPLPHFLSIILARKWLPAPNGNPFSGDIECDRWAVTNREAFGQLQLYPDNDVAAFFDEQRRKTGNCQLHMYYTAAAAARGNEAAVDELLDPKSPLDFKSVSGRISAISFALESDRTPDTIYEKAIALLGDNRGATVDNPDEHSQVRIRDIADDLIPGSFAMAPPERTHHLLLRLARAGTLPPALLWTFADRPDPDAEKLLLKMAADALEPDSPTADLADAAIHGLGKLHSRAAVPLLLAHLNSRGAISALAEIKSEAALPALERLIRTGTFDDGTSAITGTAAGSVDEARVAIAVITPGNPTKRLCQLLADPSLAGVQRREIVSLLAADPDPAAVDPLLRVIASDPNEILVDDAIGSLGRFQTRSAVVGLIEALGHTEKRETQGPGNCTAEGFDDLIVASLRSMTGESIGPDQARWKTWWQDHGRNDPGFSS